ncbi:MAG: biotin--[acetyl-CoA-carboxylase] ligase [Actinobacteria bacterium]|nr:biotin--[acetyl-CoA-carboxylase] ligase [Actinomycetota bacterium]MBU1609317.1 biotin--[acetyl-CoA-carboxylase] ligase [Actinomycetota bacterium]MBU2314949.1 biotin--[acetyl-CoA-carboxylase] ligase [Actinomycetota bacterium]MBU2385085.1 biotin--[acetyl-CoA-carboxylase] ligase [Actinomycetota bacterium]
MHLPLSRRASDELGVTLIWRDASASTNGELVSQAALADLTVMATDTQTAGRGRLDRAWSTPPGTALAVSAFLAHEPSGADPAAMPDSRRLGWVPLLAGVAMVRAVRGLGVGAAGLKWPNDVLVDGRKLCGILTELTPTGVVVGAGLNVSMTAQQRPVPTATSLVIEGLPEHGEPVHGEASTLLDRALAAYLRELVPLVGRRREAEHPADLRPLVEQHLQTLGLAVRVDLPGQPPLRGVAVGLDDDGRLLVRSGGDDSGVTSGATSGVVAVAAGDVTHLRYE